MIDRNNDVCLHHFWFQKGILVMCFMLHRVYIRSALGHVGSDELSDYMVAVALETVTLELLECVFCLDILPDYKRCSFETFVLSSRFSFCFTKII
jgi:hypothetical protein